MNKKLVGILLMCIILTIVAIIGIGMTNTLDNIEKNINNTTNNTNNNTIVDLERPPFVDEENFP